MNNQIANTHGYITAILCSPLPATSTSTVHSQIPATPVYTYSDLSVEYWIFMIPIFIKLVTSILRTKIRTQLLNCFSSQLF